MSLFSEYASIIINSLLKLQEGDTLSVNTEECDFEFARVIADMAVRKTKTISKIVITSQGRPSEVVDFDPYEPAVQTKALCMLHLNHCDESVSSDEKVLDVIVDKNDLRAIQKLGHLADPVILDRKIVISWCVIPSFYANNPELESLVNRLSKDIDGQILASKYRKKYLNQTDIDKLHFYSDSCDFTIDLPENVQFIGGLETLSNGREFVPTVDFQNLMCNVDKNSINGWFNASSSILGKKVSLKLTFDNGALKNNYECIQLKNILTFDEDISKVGMIEMGDKYFVLHFGCSSVESLRNKPESEDNLPSWFNQSIYKFECKLDEKLNIEYYGCDGKYHELVRKGFFLE